MIDRSFVLIILSKMEIRTRGWPQREVTADIGRAEWVYAYPLWRHSCPYLPASTKTVQCCFHSHRLKLYSAGSFQCSWMDSDRNTAFLSILRIESTSSHYSVLTQGSPVLTAGLALDLHYLLPLLSCWGLLSCDYAIPNGHEPWWSEENIYC